MYVIMQRVRSPHSSPHGSPYSLGMRVVCAIDTRQFLMTLRAHGNWRVARVRCALECEIELGDSSVTSLSACLRK